MQHVREHEFVDVLGTVAEMRSHRLSMVQTEVSREPPSCSSAVHQGLPAPALTAPPPLPPPLPPPPSLLLLLFPFLLLLFLLPPVQEQYVFIHQCVLLMWQKMKQQLSITSDVIYENTSKT